MFKLSQETIAIVTVGLTILGTIPYSTGRLEDRIRADMQAIRAEARADREAWQAESCGEPQPRPAATRSAGRARWESDAWGWNTRAMVATGGIEPPTSRL